MSKEIMKADPAFKKKILWFVIFATIIGAILLNISINRIRYLSSTDIYATAKYALLLLWILLGIPFVFGSYMISLGLKCLAANQFPPPNTKVLKDTIILRDQDARRKSIALIGASVLLMILCAGTGYYSYKILIYIILN